MPNFVDSLAPERFARYLAWAGQDADLAHRLYARNVAIAEAFYTPLHVLEIVLRNRVDQSLGAVFGPTWFNDPAVVTTPPLQAKVRDANRRLTSLGPALSRGHVVAELNFGFWTGMFNRHQHHFWRHLRSVFGAASGLQRGGVSGRLDDIRGLRKRIAHYEAILHLDLMTHYREIHTLTTWLYPDAAGWLVQHSRCLVVCPPGLIIVNGRVDPALVGTI